MHHRASAELLAVQHLTGGRIYVCAADDALSYDALRAGPADYAVVRPLTSLFAQTRHPGILHALLLCRQHFLDVADDELAFQGECSSSLWSIRRIRG